MLQKCNTVVSVKLIAADLQLFSSFKTQELQASLETHKSRTMKFRYKIQRNYFHIIIYLTFAQADYKPHNKIKMSIFLLETEELSV